MNDKKLKPNGTTMRVYDYIIAYSDKHGFPPSVREIASTIKLKSTSTVFYHISKLEQSGLLKRDPYKNRAIEIAGRATSTPLLSVPIVGKVAAGSPILAVENITDTVDLPADLFGGTSLFLLKVQGDSMIDAGILDGDMVVVDKRETADNGEIVVAMIEDEATVKRFYREQDKIRLQPENKNYEPIIVREDVSIVGKVIGLIRDKF